MKKILMLALCMLMIVTVCVSAQAATATQTGTGVTVIKAADWAETYPDVYASYEKNAENKDIIDHVEEYPMIATVYEGMAFNKFYGSARGHYYTVQDVTSTGRPHALANCFTCKTPDFTAKVNNEGVSAYQIPFEDMLAEVNESVSCYNCHANTGNELVVTHTYLADAMGEELAGLNAETASCAQCHVEYYFAPETKAVTLPYDRITGRIQTTGNLEFEPVVLWPEAENGDLIAVFSTYYDPAQTTQEQIGRLHNIMQGVQRLNDVIVPAGEKFYFNDYCAPYTASNGYMEGPIINYVSSTKLGYGGGICQVSTTLYNAILQIPIEVIKQQVHSSYGIEYAPLDFDAAVGNGNIDLRLRNTLPYDVRFVLQAVDGVLTVLVYRAS